MAARQSTSLLLLVALLGATYFSCASAFNRGRSEDLHGRKFLSPTPQKIEAGRAHNSFVKLAPAHRANTENVRTGFNQGGAVLQPTATDTYFSRIVDHQAKTYKIHAGSEREVVTEIRPAVSPVVKKDSSEKSMESESGITHTYSSRVVAHQAKSSDNVRTGFNRGGAFLHSAPKDTYYSRTVTAHTKAKSNSTDNVRAGLNGNRDGRTVTLHPAPKKAFADNDSKTSEPRSFSRAVGTNQAKTHNVYTGFNRGGAVLH